MKNNPVGNQTMEALKIMARGEAIMNVSNGTAPLERH